MLRQDAASFRIYRLLSARAGVTSTGLTRGSERAPFQLDGRNLPRTLWLNQNTCAWNCMAADEPNNGRTLELRRSQMLKSRTLKG